MASAAAAPRAHLTGPSRVPWEGAAGAPAAGDLDCGTQLRSRLIRLPAAARPRVRTSGLPWPLTQIARGRSDIGKAEEYEAIQRETQRELALANVPGVGDLFGGPDQHPPVPTCRPPTPPPSPHTSSVHPRLRLVLHLHLLSNPHPARTHKSSNTHDFQFSSHAINNRRAWTSTSLIWTAAAPAGGCLSPGARAASCPRDPRRSWARLDVIVW